MKILGTGMSGLLGARITSVLSNVEFTSISRSTGVDVTDINSLRPHILEFPGDYVLHMAAKADVDGCEKDKEQGEEGEAWKINVIGTKNVAEVCREAGKKMIYISTDFVFDGEKPAGDTYSEEDTPSPINWYGETKFQGENEIRKSGAEHTILRIAYPYGPSSAPKKDFVRIIAGRLQENLPIKGVTDHIFVPTYIDDIAMAIQTIIEKNARGLFHVVGSAALSPYDAAVLIAKIVGINPEVIGVTTRAEYFANKATRPFNLQLSNAKIVNLGVTMRPFEEGLKDTII